MKTRQVPWVRLSAEMAAIVVSILLAFWIDAWWDAVQRRGEEREVLVGLQAEFTGHVAALEEAIKWNREAARSAAFLSEQHGARTELQDSLVLEVERALSWVNSGYMVDLRGGVRDALLVSGRLELIREPELRAKLSSWATVVDDVATNEATIRRFVMDILTPYVAEHDIPLDRSLTYPVGAGSDAAAPGLWRRYAALLAQQEFRNLVSVRRLWDLGSLAKYDRALAEARVILDLLAIELAGS